jgi:hypothetical protein
MHGPWRIMGLMRNLNSAGISTIAPDTWQAAFHAAKSACLAHR